MEPDLYRNAAFSLASQLGETIVTASTDIDALTAERDEWRARAERAEAAQANILAAHRRLIVVDGCEVWACEACDQWASDVYPDAPQCETAAIILEAQAQTAHPDLYSCYCDSVCGCAAAPADPTGHDFQPVAGHPDDDECTYRADGTDEMYCGEPRDAHAPADPHAEKVARIRRIRRMVDDLEWFADLQGWAKPYLWTRDARAEADRLERCPVTRTEANPKVGENT